LNKKILFLILSSITLFAETTMCYKENVTSISNIENIKLDGGKCESQNSLNEMKELGWNVDDINVSKNSDGGMNYIYILKNEKQYNAADIENIEQKILQKLENRKVEDEKRRIEEIKIKMSREGKIKYVKKCQSCHGENAELKALGTSRPLITLNLDQMITSIHEYQRHAKDNGNGVVMTPYAKSINERDIKNIYSYILTLKPEEKKENK
jgi:cytochrome c553